MCKVGDKIRFCTCSTDAENKKAYWTFYKHQDDLAISVDGDLIMPLLLDPEVDHLNRSVLLQRINEKDAWDFDLAPKHLDRLSVTLTCKKDGEEGYITYGFEFDESSNKFIECEYDAFDWLSNRTEEGSGEVKSTG